MDAVEPHSLTLVSYSCTVNKLAPMQSTRAKQLSPLEFSAWAGLLRAHAALVRELDRELAAAHALPQTQY